MSKFLEGIENNMPEKDIDLLTAGKRALQSFLLSKDVAVQVRTFADELSITLEDGSVVKLEVKDYVKYKPPVEDAETDIKKTAETAAAVLAIPNPGLKALVPGSAAAKVHDAKKKLADKLVAAADSIQIP